MHLFLCMKWGTRYGAEYVNRLQAGLVRVMRAPFELVCLTDDSTGVAPPVRCLPLPPFENVPEPLFSKPWKKLALWHEKLGSVVGAPDLDGRTAVFLDLDLVLVGDLVPLFAQHPGAPFVVWRNPTKPKSGIGNTSVFRFQLGSHPEILARFLAGPLGVKEHEFKIEQELISARLGDGTATRHAARTPAAAADAFYAGLGVQRFFEPGLIVSFKEDVLPRWPVRLWQTPTLPPGAAVVVFHGKPDPDDVRDGRWPAPWYKRWYKTVRPTPWLATCWGAD